MRAGARSRLDVILCTVDAQQHPWLKAIKDLEQQFDAVGETIWRVTQVKY